MATDEEINREAGHEAWQECHQALVDALESKGVTMDYTALRIKQGMNAKETKAIYDREIGWQYSQPMVDHNIRFKYVEMVISIRDAKPPERHEHSGAGGGPIEYDLRGVWSNAIKDDTEA